jgi:H+/gluconate symporter-like permease
MKEPHNYRSVGWAMIAVAASLAIIGLIVVTPVGHDPYFSSKIMKQKQADFEEKKQMEEQLKNMTSNTAKTGMLVLSVYLK